MLAYFSIDGNYRPDLKGLRLIMHISPTTVGVLMEITDLI